MVNIDFFIDFLKLSKWPATLFILFTLSQVHPQKAIYLKEPRLYPQYYKAIKKDRVEADLNIKNTKEKILYKNGWMEVTGKDKASQYNQLAVSFLNKYKWQQALETLDMAIKKVPYLYALRFNRGRIYLYQRNHRKAIIEFRKALGLVPIFFGNYFFLGKAYQLAADHDSALYQYRLAYRYNPYSLVSLIAIGDLLIIQNRLTEAEKYYVYALKIDDGYNDALIGMGKVAYKKGNFFDATLFFKMINYKKPYAKILHYYYAESAFYNKMYPLAVLQYKKILEYPNDEVFNIVSLSRMKFRLRQAEKFILRKN